VDSSESGPGSFDLGVLVPDSWCRLLELLGLRGMILNIASHCELRRRDGTDLEFVLDEAHSTLLNDTHAAKLRLALENFFGVPLSVTLAPGQVHGETPAMRSARMAEERQAEAVIAIEEDPQLQALITRFDGELDRSSIQPNDV